MGQAIPPPATGAPVPPDPGDPLFADVIGLYTGKRLVVNNFITSKLQDFSTFLLHMQVFGTIDLTGEFPDGYFTTEVPFGQSAADGRWTGGSNIAPGVGDFCWEGLLYMPNPVAFAGFIVETRPNPPGFTVHPCLTNNNGHIGLYCAGAGGVLMQDPAISPALTWLYCCLERYSGTSRIYLGPAAGATVPIVCSVADANNYLNNGLILQAASNATGNYIGKMQQWRFTRRARYNGAATIACPTQGWPKHL